MLTLRSKDCGSGFFELFYTTESAGDLEKLNNIISEHSEYTTDFREDMNEYICNDDSDTDFVDIHGNSIDGNLVTKKLVVRSIDGKFLQFLKNYVTNKFNNYKSN